MRGYLILAVMLHCVLRLFAYQAVFRWCPLPLSPSPMSGWVVCGAHPNLLAVLDSPVLPGVIPYPTPPFCHFTKES